MTRKSIRIAALLFLVSARLHAGEVVPAEVPTTVALSNHDINRIVCSGQMSDLIFSQEKGITGHFSGNNAFIKFKIEQQGDELVYADSPSELFVVCNDTVYTLIVTPKDIASVTLRLGTPQGESIAGNIAHHKNLPLEKQALQIIREAYNGTYPSSYRINTQGQEIPFSPDLTVNLTQVVDVDGVGLRLKQYELISIAQGETYLQEKDFLNPAVGASILAVAIENHNLASGETTRAFVVEKKEQQ